MAAGHSEQANFLSDCSVAGPPHLRSIYRLRIVPPDQVDFQEYFTMSAQGLTCVDKATGTSEFIPMETWLRERALYEVLVQKRFFQEYRVRKNFFLWRDFVRRKARSTVCPTRRAFLPFPSRAFDPL